MKDITLYINEATEKLIDFSGDVLHLPVYSYKLDITVKNQAKSAGKQAHNMEYGASFTSLKDFKEELNLIFKQGCKWIIAYPPHKSMGNDVDYYTVTMFTSSKKIHDQYMGAERQVVINLKTCKIENESALQQEGKDWKIIRLD